MATTVTNSEGYWYFNNSNVTDGDCITAGNQTGLQPNKQYIVKIGSADWASGAGTGDLNLLSLTIPNATVTGLIEASDNDATLVSSIPQIVMNTSKFGENNHTYDIGFIPYVPCALPTFVFTQTAPTCSVLGIANDDGKIALTASSNADKYGVSVGASYSGPAYSSATTIGTTPIDVRNSIPNTGGTYTIRLFNQKDDCYKDTTITVAAVICTPVCTKPIPTFTQTASTCTGGTANNDGKITLTSVTNADKYGISTGASYTGPAYAAAITASPLPLDVQTAIPNAGATYTLRLFNGANDCFQDTTIVIAAVTCVCPPSNYDYCPGDSYTLDAGTGLTGIQWYKDGQPILGATNQTYIVTALGSYHFEATLVTNGCPANGCCPIVFVPGTCTLPCPIKVCLPLTITRN
jgi:hypothetical protein